MSVGPPNGKFWRTAEAETHPSGRLFLGFHANSFEQQEECIFPTKNLTQNNMFTIFHQFCAASILSARNSSQSIQALVTCSMARVENNSAGREPLTSGHTWTLKSAILGPTVLVPFPVLSLHDLRLY